MKFFHKAKDGGPESNVTGYWLIESKKFFSIALLKFSKGSREAYHNHAFNAWSMIFKGRLREEVLVEADSHFELLLTMNWFLEPWKLIYTSRDRTHRVHADEVTWAITIRGPWADSWKEFFAKTGKWVTLTNGRKIVKETHE